MVSNERKILSSQVQRRVNAVLVTFLLFSASSSAFAACHTVSPNGSGSKNGTDWNNAYAGIPSTLVRGDVYYLADGSYPALEFTTAASGTTTVEIRKAQVYDYGRTSDGCSNDISAGWSASTMGAAQAVFSSTLGGHMFYLEDPYLVINGNGQQTTAGCGGTIGNDPTANPGTITDCGIKIDDTTACGTDLISQTGGVANFTASYLEVHGCGNASSEDYIIRADSSANWSITHMYLHYFGAVCAVIGGTSHFTFDDNYMFRNQIVAGSNPTHGQCLQSSGDGGNLDVSRNVFRDLGGTAIMMSWVGSGSVQSGPYNFYDNVIWNTPGFTPIAPSANGLLACINGFTCNNVTMSQNTIVGMTHGAETGIDSETGGTYTVQNNLYYDNTSYLGDLNGGGTFTESHNSYLTSGTSCPSGTANVCDNSSANPLVSWTTGNFTLATDAADWNNRISLGSPFTTDANGVTFTTDRGAYQFGGGSGAPVPPTGLAAVIQ